jgi:peptide/nickel transport system substrate-binding protein
VDLIKNRSSLIACILDPKGLGSGLLVSADGWVVTNKHVAPNAGPFRVVQFHPGREIELERNPYYWRAGYPRSEGLIFHCGVSPEEIRSEFQAGRFALASELYPADVEALRQDPELAAGYREVPRLSVYFVALNSRSGPLKDIALRRRLLQGIDVPGMVKRTLGRLALPAHGVIPPGLVGHKPAVSWPTT